jgi:AcrR family transcriptional regulator
MPAKTHVMTGRTGANDGRRRRLTAPRRRRQLLDVALDTFAEKGFNDATMEDIATAAGVTKPLLYQHFTSKRALYLELIDDVTARLIDALAAAAATNPKTRAQVEAEFLAYFRFAIENPAAVRMLFHAPRDEELARGLRTIEESITQFLAPLFDADIDDDYQRVLAAAIVGMTEGVTRDWLQGAGAGPADDAAIARAETLAERLTGLVWGGVRSLNKT